MVPKNTCFGPKKEHHQMLFYQKNVKTKTCFNVHNFTIYQCIAMLHLRTYLKIQNCVCSYISKYLILYRCVFIQITSSDLNAIKYYYLPIRAIM